MEKSINILKSSGKCCLILPHNFINTKLGDGIRSFLSSNQYVEEIVHFGSHLVFEEASTYTCIITLSHGNKNLRYAEINPINLLNPINFSILDLEVLNNDTWNLNSKDNEKVLNKLNNFKYKIKDFFDYISRGVITGYDAVFIVEGKVIGDTFYGFSKALNSNIELESAILKPMLMGSSFSRYSSLQTDKFLIYPHTVDQNKTVPIDIATLETEYPKVFQCLLNFKDELIAKKIKYKTNPEYWYSLHNSREMSIFENEKILVPYLCLKSQMTYDNSSFYSNDKCSALLLKPEFSNYYKYFLSIFNSDVMWFFITKTSSEFSGGYFAYSNLFLENFPLPEIPENADEFIAKAEQTLSLNQALQETVDKFLRTLNRKFDLSDFSKNLQSWHLLSYKDFVKELAKKKIKLSLGDEAEWEDYFLAEQAKAQSLQNQIAQTDDEINQMVYALYGLTDDEIKIIE